MAANLNVDEALPTNGEDSATSVDKAGLTSSSCNATQGKPVSPPAVPELCGTEKAAASNNLIAKVLAPLSSNDGSFKPCDGRSAVTPQNSPQTATSPSLGPDSSGSKTSTLTSGQKRARESDISTSNIPVKRRLRLSEDTEEEGVQDYDERCAELWIDGEMAACEAFELSQPSSNARRQPWPRDPRQVYNGIRRNNNLAQPPTQKMDGVHPGIIACFTELIKLFHNTDLSRRVDFAGLTSLVRLMQRDFRLHSNEIHTVLVEQRKMLDALSLMSERLNAIQMYVLDTHRKITGKR